MEFHLKGDSGGTMLTVIESGFDGIPMEHRAEAFRRNEGGWAAQVENIKSHVGG